MKKVCLLLVITLVCNSCADVEAIDSCVVNEPYGFFSGLWHGMISPFSFFGSLLDSDIAIYGINNNGGWYDFGFVLGAGILFGGSSSAAK